MLLAKVIGNIWSTKKKDEISTLRLLLIQPLGDDLKPAGKVIVAADEIGAGFEEMVIVTRGAPAMQAFSREKPIPIDAVVIGIVDNLEMADKTADRKE
jgi:microcompartment protein CcmK/EutM